MINPASVLLAGSSLQSLLNSHGPATSGEFSVNAEILSSYYRTHSSFASAVSVTHEFSNDEFEKIMEVDAQMVQILSNLSKAADLFKPKTAGPYVNWLYSDNIGMYEHLANSALSSIDCVELLSVSSANDRLYSEFMNIQHASWISSDLMLTRPWPFVNIHRCQSS